MHFNKKINYNNLYKYNYVNAKSFLEQGNDDGHKMAFSGEIYEALFMENLLLDNYSSNCQIVSKGPHAKARNYVVSTGFSNLNGYIIYRSNKVDIAEFDAIKICEDSLIFYECTLSKTAKKLKKGILRKKFLLEKYFQIKTLFVL